MQGTPNPNIFSVFGRFGAITAQSGDYTFAQIGSTPTTLSGYGITDAQALDADLTAIAGLSTTGTIERTGAGTASTYTVTAAAKTVLDDATVGDMLTTLGGVGAASPTFTGVVTVPAGTVSAPGIAATGDSNTGIYFPAADTVAITEGGVEALRITDAGNLQFNSGYGSVATAYGCRAWVNFDGSGTVAIRASGNVSSITDNSTGNYTVNFANPLPDTNYSFVGFVRKENAVLDALFIVLALGTDTKTVSALQIRTPYITAGNSVIAQFDFPEINVAVFR